MSLSPSDYEWLTDQFKEVREGCSLAIKEHVEAYHPPGHPLRTIGAVLGIGVATLTILGSVLAGLLWLIQNAPKP